MRKELIALQEMLGVTAEQRPPDSSWGRGLTLLGDGCWAGVAFRGCCCLPSSDVLEDNNSIRQVESIFGAMHEGKKKKQNKKKLCDPTTSLDADGVPGL